jgi:hypothetical protein
MRMTSPTLSLLARDLLLEAQAHIEAHPQCTVGLAAHLAHHAPHPTSALEELFLLPSDLLDLSGAEACEAVSSLLQAADYPDLSPTIPAPAPTVEALPEAQLLTAAGLVAHAWELIDQARQHLGAHHEADVARLQIDLEQLGARLMAEVEGRSAAFSCREAAE